MRFCSGTPLYSGRVYSFTSNAGALQGLTKPRNYCHSRRRCDNYAKSQALDICFGRENCSELVIFIDSPTFPPPSLSVSSPCAARPSGPDGRVSEENRGQRGPHLHQQRHSLLHGRPHPHPGTQGLLITGTFQRGCVVGWDSLAADFC